MKIKLQQAIVATRAGQIEVAQSLLTQLLREDPENANAWFLLGNLVDSQDRQIRYLQKAVELDPENAIAKKQLEQMQGSLIPAPVIWQGENDDDERGADEPEAVPVPANSTREEESSIDEAREVTADQLPEWLQNLDQKQLGSDSSSANEWTDTAGVPIRESSKIAQEAQAQQVPQDGTSNDKSGGEVWLVRILVIMVILAAIVLGFLVLLILVQP
ncbi:MAG: tetratricopeptide repeat protein [Anaerolineaceae bacterium]|nr:MAG: tetratricopeptide repeat protein [Anaerolineaceae bacterium]